LTVVLHPSDTRFPFPHHLRPAFDLTPLPVVLHSLDIFLPPFCIAYLRRDDVNTSAQAPATPVGLLVDTHRTRT
jgi:hypothetical protein